MEPGVITSRLLTLMVTLPCDHSYYRQLEPGYQKKFRDGIRKAPEVKQGLYLSNSKPDADIWLQAVDQNSTGQWLTYQYNSSCTILQRNRCIECTLRAMESVEAYAVKIIPGRLQGEELETDPHP